MGSIKTVLAAGTGIVLALMSSQAVAQVRNFNIRSMPADEAVQELARQGGVQIIVPTEKLKGLRTHAVQGQRPVGSAIETMLLGTKLRAEKVAEGVYVIKSTQTSISSVRAQRLASLSQLGPVPTPVPQRAQEASADFGDIVVTAQRRQQSIQNVGISVTAISGEALSNLGVTSAQGIAAHVPSLVFDSGSGGSVNAFVTIRGVSQVDYSEHQEAPNAVYLDEVYVPTPSMVGFPVYDVARVEALRGPQGTLFGRNSTGGLLQFVTASPTDEFTGFFDGSFANYSTFRVEGAVSGPIANGLNFRVAGYMTQGDGFYKNRNPGDKDQFEKNEFGIRSKLGADLGGGWKAMLTGSYNKSPRHREGAYKSRPSYVDASGVPQFLPADLDFYGTGPGNDPFGYRDPSNDGHVGSFNSDEGYLEKEFYYSTLKVEGPVGDATLVSISNYSHARLKYSEDSDSTPNRVFVFRSSGRTRQVSQELRLSGDTGRLDYTVGAYFLDLKGAYATDFDFEIFAGTPDAFRTINDYDQHTQSFAAFGQIEYKLTDELKAIVGGRYTHDRKQFKSIVFDATTPANTVVYEFSRATVGDLVKQSRSDWAGKAQLDYQPSRDLLFYAGISRGIRGGGFNATADGTLPLEATPFGNETVIAYEGGTKLRLFDGAARLYLSGFYYDYSDYQAFNYVGLISRVSNNDAYYYGAEAEFSATPMAGLNISLGGSYLRGKVKDLAKPDGSLIDVDPVKAPRYTLNGIVTKKFQVGNGELTLQYDFDYLSRTKANLVPSPVTSLAGSWIQNARVSFGREEFGWEAYGFVRNLANADRKTFAYDNSFVGINLSSYAPPRTYGVGFRKTF